MIVVDTSALIAIVAEERAADQCSGALKNRSSVLISAGTLTELLIVAARRNLSEEIRDLIGISITQVIDLTPARAQSAASAYAQWGKGFHKAALNFGDCFAYATAREFDCPLLYVGEDYARTDVRSAIPADSL